MRAIVWAGVFAVLVAVPVAAAPMTCRTLVFEDRDGDGRRDRDEPGIAGVALWAAPTLHRTGDDGVAVVPVRAGDRIALVKPAGWLAAWRADGLPDTWREASGRRRCAVAFDGDTGAGREPFQLGKGCQVGGRVHVGGNHR